ncbi:uncharacterized protein BDFB_002486 [Asbolus verrucosus]|uniref:DBF4-type domain-containing protein n=1 Tax=Asbolus verrucosus TaxID=1661398 RepID=A0A482W6J4_ASBVE|nr:uncharacterized protein BDFB_002486 [Asbolus verrucosus]
MFEKRTRLRVKTLLEKQFDSFRELEQSLKNNLTDRELDSKSVRERVSLNRSTNERNMTRKTRSRQPRIHSVFQSGYCELCHIQYSSLEDHIQSKRHLKLIEEDGSFISIKGFDSFLALDGVDSLEVNGKNCVYRRRSKMPRTRTSSLMCDRIKDSPMSPISDSGHHLRSRKNINYMTPPLEEDSLTEKPEVVKEFRELRSSSRLLAKFADQMVENDEVWNSGRPKRSCNKQRISADERLVVDNKSYYKVEVLSSKLRSGVTPFHPIVKRPETPVNETKNDDKGLIVKFKKLRNSELIQLNNEAENFLFPKKDESSEEEDEDDDDDKDKGSRNDSSSINSDVDVIKKIKVEDEESMHSTSSESKGKKRRRTHAEAFIMDNQKYYKFETPGSRLRYHGSYLSPVPMKFKNNGECVIKNEPDYLETVKNFKLNLNDYNFSFESVPKNEVWYQTFQRRDKGEEKYAYLSDDNYWNPLILPYQLDYVPPLDPQECISQYNQIKKCLIEPPSASTSVTCSTPDPNASNSSTETPFMQDEDSKISATEVSSNSTLDEVKPSRSNKRTRRSGVIVNTTGNGKNPRKSPRQHASTLAILSSLIQQRKRKSRRSDLELRSSLPTIVEEPKQRRSPKKSKIDYFSILKNVEDEFAIVCEENLSEVDIDKDEQIDFKGKVEIEDILNVYEPNKDNVNKTTKRLAKPGRKPGKRKKNRTGWPLSRSRRLRRDHVTKEDDIDDSTVDSLSVNADSEENDVCEDMNSTDSIKKKESVAKLNSENNNKNDQSSLGDVNIEDTNCDLNNADRVGKNENKSDDVNSDKVLTNKVNNSDGFNIDLQYQPYVRRSKEDARIAKIAENVEKASRAVV